MSMTSTATRHHPHRPTCPTDLPPNAGRAAAGHRDRARRPADADPRRDRRERRPPAHRRRPRLRPGLAVVGAQRLHARLRRPAAARRPPRRRLRPAAASSRSAWRVFTARLAARRPGPDPGAGWSPPAAPRASAPRWPHPACSPCSPPAPPTRPPATGRSRSSAPSPRAARRSACCSAASSPTSARGAGRCSSTSRSASPCSALTRRFVDETPLRPGRFDVVGALTATLGAVSIVWALIGAPEHGWASVRTVGGLAVGALLLVVLARHRDPRLAPDDPAAPAAQPPPGRRAWPSSPWSSAARCRCSSSPCSTSSGELGFGPLATGLAFLPLTLGIFAMSRVTPRLLARFGRTPMFVVGTIGLATSFAWLSQVSAGDTLPQRRLRPDAAQRALAPAWCSCRPPRRCSTGVEPEHAGSASGLLQTFQQLGGAIGLAVIVSVYAAGAVPGQFLPGAGPRLPHLGDVRPDRPRGRRPGQHAGPPGRGGRAPARGRHRGARGRRGGLTGCVRRPSG